MSRSEHEGFSGLHDGNRVVKVSLTKDVPASVRVAGYDCRVWYRRQPAFCTICKKSGHRSKSCPLDGPCRRCRQLGHVAKECRNAWGPRRADRDAPSGSSVPSSSAAPAARPTADAAPSVIHDVVMDSGDEEVVAGAAEAAAAAASSSRPASRRRRRQPRKDRGAVPFPTPGTIGSHHPADLSSLEMDLSGDDESKVSFLSTIGEVWRDQLSWEELRSLHHGRVLKKSGDSIRSVAGVPLLFGSASEKEEKKRRRMRSKIRISENSHGAFL